MKPDDLGQHRNPWISNFAVLFVCGGAPQARNTPPFQLRLCIQNCCSFSFAQNPQSLVLSTVFGLRKKSDRNPKVCSLCFAHQRSYFCKGQHQQITEKEIGTRASIRSYFCDHQYQKILERNYSFPHRHMGLNSWSKKTAPLPCISGNASILRQIVRNHSVPQCGASQDKRDFNANLTVLFVSHVFFSGRRRGWGRAIKSWYFFLNLCFCQNCVFESNRRMT